jgi:hypothetical protein
MGVGETGWLVGAAQRQHSGTNKNLQSAARVAADTAA